MNGDERRAHWNRKYEQGLPSLTKPDPFFVSAYERFVAQSFPKAGMALDLAAGLGRHALWLASKRWEVTAVDISEVAIERLADAADQLNLKLNAIAIDAAEYNFEPLRFDLIILFYLWERSLLPKIVSALNPGGLLISKLRVQRAPDIPVAKSAGKPLGGDELLLLLPTLQVIYHRERPVGDQGVAEFVGRKPGPDYRTSREVK